MLAMRPYSRICISRSSRGPEAAQPSDYLIEIGHDEIEVYGCPMPPEIARHLCRAKLCHSRAVGEEEDRQISAHKLHPPRPELRFWVSPSPPQ
jgi:hypothetical protein